MNQLNSFDKKVRTDIVAPVFTDGMVVTANDLTSSMHYPVELLQTLVRAFFGCGVVCGLSVEPYHDRGGGDGKWCLIIHPGTALDCRGYPLKLCECQKLDLKPDPCFCGELPERLCIALKRCTVKEGPRDDANSCDADSKAGQAYGRLREYVGIKVFDPNDCDLPELCVKGPAAEEAQTSCDCLKACPDACCGESWVVLACVTLDECDGITGIEDCRKYVKPVYCHCLPVEAPCDEEPEPQFVAAKKKASRSESKSSRSRAK